MRRRRTRSGETSCREASALRVVPLLLIERTIVRSVVVAMRSTRALQAALLLGVGLGAFFEGMLFHPIAGFFYFVAWVLSVAGVVLLWSALRGPGRLPAGGAFAASYLVGWGVFNMV